MSETIVTKTAAERFVKERIRPEARVGPGVISTLITRLDTIADQAVRKADALSGLAGRTTIMERDLVEAFDTVSPVGGGQLADPATVFAALDRMSTEQLGQLVRKIQAWLASRPKKS